MWPVFQYAITWVNSHPVAVWSTVAVGVYHLFSASVDSLDPPDSTSGKFYRWFYKMSNRFAANYSKLGGVNLEAG
jgi:hypothetical protein